MSSQRLPDATIDRIAELAPGWTLTPGRDAIERRFVFADFREAFAFMGKVAAEAERVDHHPDWSNTYNRVTIRLTTHDAGGLTQQDVDLARWVNELLG